MAAKSKTSPIQAPAASTAAELPPPLAVEAPLSIPRFGPWARLLIYCGCVAVPGGALALGMLYAVQNDRDAKIFGRICLGLGLLGLMIRAGSGGEFRNLQSGESLTQPFY